MYCLTLRAAAYTIHTLAGLVPLEGSWEPSVSCLYLLEAAIGVSWLVLIFLQFIHIVLCLSVSLFKFPLFFKVIFFSVSGIEFMTSGLSGR